ncbi:4346_t:CDS:2, partial [Paraglomus occultum]
PEALGKRKIDGEDNCDSKKLQATISIEGPLSLESPVLMLPITEQEIFSEVYTGILGGKSFVIHGLYQSGKTSFLLLWALEETLKKKKEPNSTTTVVYLDMSDISKNCNQMDAEEAFSHFMSFSIFGQTLSWSELVGQLQHLSPNSRLYLLADEFQFVFHASDLLQVACDFFRNLSSKKAVSYVSVGTFKLMELQDDDGNLDSPFNKAAFCEMPFFTHAEAF